MTINEYLKQKGLESRVKKFKKWASVNVGFSHADGTFDETQLDIMFPGTKAGAAELSELYSEFCRENNFAENTVENIVVIKCADIYDDLP